MDNDRLKAYVSAAGRPYLTPNEARAQLNLPPAGPFAAELLNVRLYKKRQGRLTRALGLLVALYVIWKPS
jgi:phage portal protein BeeE